MLPLGPEEGDLLASALASPLGASSLLAESVLSAISVGSVRLRLVSAEEQDALEATLREMETRWDGVEWKEGGARLSTNQPGRGSEGWSRPCASHSAH